MLKTDRGTILYLRLFKVGAEKPMVVNVFSDEISGISFDTTALDTAFKESIISGFTSNPQRKSISLIKKTGVLVDATNNFGFSDEIEKIEFTVVYPDGTTKMGVRSMQDGINTLIWDDNLIRNIKKMKRDFYWTGDLERNPALLVIKNGEVIDRACDPSTTHGCNGY